MAIANISDWISKVDSYLQAAEAVSCASVRETNRESASPLRDVETAGLRGVSGVTAAASAVTTPSNTSRTIVCDSD